MLQYFQKLLPLVESPRCSLQDEIYVMGWGPTGFCPKLEIIKNGGNLHFFYTSHVEYGIIQHFLLFTTL